MQATIEKRALKTPEQRISDQKFYVKRWRQRNREHYLAKCIEYSRKRRALLQSLKPPKLATIKADRIPKCHSCKSIVKKDMYYCDWCIRTYQYTQVDQTLVPMV